MNITIFLCNDPLFHNMVVKDPMPLPPLGNFILGLLERKSIPFPTTPLKDPTPLPRIGNSPWDGERIMIPVSATLERSHSPCSYRKFNLGEESNLLQS
jgi:hypothetical protein